MRNRKLHANDAPMSAMRRTEYLTLRRHYAPQVVKLVIVAESPPVSGKYSYQPDGLPNEPLFATLMHQLGHSAISKKSGLRQFQRSGWILVDATYEPVNMLRPSRGRNSVIARDYSLLRDDLASLASDRSTPVILIKANICRLLAPKLLQDGFNVANRDVVIPFPAMGHQERFHQAFSAVIKSLGILSERH